MSDTATATVITAPPVPGGDHRVYTDPYPWRQGHTHEITDRRPRDPQVRSA